MVTAPVESAVVVPVPEVEPVVAAHRRLLDPSAPWGVPAHVTVLYPFLHPSDIDQDVVRRLTDACRTVSAFECTFRRCRWFDRDVLWLEPQPDLPFRALTAAVFEEFPDHPPYAGTHPDIVPHLTVGQADETCRPALSAVEPLVADRLPVTAYVDRVLLLAGAREPGSWRTWHEVTLPPAR